MISDILTRIISEDIPSLTLGTNLFSEQSKGNQCVTVITRELSPWPGMPLNFRQALIEVEVKGYRMAEANALSEAILMLLDGMQGEYSIHDDIVTLRNIQLKQLPCFQHDGTCTHTFRVFFLEGE